GIMEDPKSATVTVDNDAPVINPFTVSIAKFAPRAPRGVAADRSVKFALTATDISTNLPTQIEIAAGTTFQPDKVVRTLQGTATHGTALFLPWDGKDAAGKVVANGDYTARAAVTDGLDSNV